MSNDNNKVRLQGTYTTGTESIREGECVIKCIISAKRQSGTVDVVPVVIPFAIYNKNLHEGERLQIEGILISQWNRTLAKPKMEIYVLAETVSPAADPEDYNMIYIHGNLCKNPIYRITPLGRKIADIIVAVNADKDSAYIPCIVWGRNADESSEMIVGDEIILSGRLQSRQYKKMENGEIQTRMAWEVSISKIVWTGCNNYFELRNAG